MRVEIGVLVRCRVEHVESCKNREPWFGPDYAKGNRLGAID